METFENLCYNKGENVLPFVDIVAAFSVVSKHLFTALSNSHSGQYTLLCSRDK